MKAFEDFLSDWRELEAEPMPEGIEAMCACGKHDLTPIILSDYEVYELWEELEAIDNELVY